ncbi:MAG: PHP domain-containing protein [Candidatus Lindowbacteria bacterium]|nr:PHP domain-containing protein [Candidatus Lindowbacteria bacterium]
MEGSYCDSALRMVPALDRIVEMGMTSFALTDHGEMSMVPTFAKEAAARGIKPIVGVEAYFAENASENILNRVNHRYHLLLLARNSTGFANLKRIVSESWKDNCLMQKLGLVDWGLLEKYNEGIVCLSGCLAGPIGWSYFKEQPEEGDRFFGRLRDVFGNRFYVEVYEHFMEEEKSAIKGLLEIADRYEAQCVLTNDCHYLDKDDWKVHDVLIKTRFGRPTDFSLPQHEYFIKNAQAMRELGFPDGFSDCTLEIADSIELTPDQIIRPQLDIAAGTETSVVFLGRRKEIDRYKALEKASSVSGLSRRQQEKLKKLSDTELEEQNPEIFNLAKKLIGLTDSAEPDLTKVVSAVGLDSRIPIRRTETIVFTMYDADDCIAAGAEIHSVDQFEDMKIQSDTMMSYKKGIALYRRRKHDLARKELQKALDLDPGFANARYQLGLVDFYSGRSSKAIGQFLKVLKDDPDFERIPHLYSYMGWCYLKIDKTDKALESFEKSLELKTIPGSLLGKGLSLDKLGETEKAKTSLLDFVEMAPDHPRIQEAQDVLNRLVG